MGIDVNLGIAFLKSQAAATGELPDEGGVFISVSDRDKPAIVDVARRFARLGYRIHATEGTREWLRENGVDAAHVYKVNEGRPNVVDQMIDKTLNLIVNTPLGMQSHHDERAIRTNAVARNVPLVTTIAAARATVEGLEARRRFQPTIKALQDYHREIRG